MKKIRLTELEKNTFPVLDLASNEFLDANPEIESRLTYLDNKKVFRFQGGSGNLVAKFVTPKKLGAYHGIRFSVYSEKATNTTVSLHFNSVEHPGGMHCEILVDFVGWKEFYKLTKDLSIMRPFPDILGFTVQVSGMAFEGALNGDTPDNLLYFTDVTAESGNFEIDAGEYDLTSPEIYRAVTDKYRTNIIGVPEVWDTPEYKANAKAASDKCADVWKRYKESISANAEKPFGLNIGRTYGDERLIQSYYTSLYQLTLGYAKPESEYYKNSELLADIKYALEFGYKNYYGENLFALGTFGNWWQWDVGIPLNLMPTLALLEDELTMEEKLRYTSTYEFLNPYPSGSGANLMWTGVSAIISGALRHDAIRILSTQYYMKNIFEYAEDITDSLVDGGFYRDGSFIQHHKNPYTAGYGKALLGMLTSLMYYLGGTPFEFSGDAISNQYAWVFENYRPVIYGKNLMACMSGREVSRGVTEQGSLCELVCFLVRMQSYAPSDAAKRLHSIIKYFMLKFKTDFSGRVALPFITFCKKLYKDDSVLPAPELEMTKVFGRMDRVVRHGKDYGACLAMSSQRVYKYESINQENKTGWYHGDGMLYVYTDDYDFGRDHYHYADPYFMPGTTVNLAARNAKCLHPQMINPSYFAGGAEHGKYGVAGFIPSTEESAFKLGTFKNEKDMRLTARKSYFFFDNEIVCLGSAIKDESEARVVTTLDNRLWRDGDVFSLDGKEVQGGSEFTEAKAKTAHFTNMGGYVVLNDAPIKYSKYVVPFDAEKGNINSPAAKKGLPFLRLITEHGIGNKDLNGSYAYALLPTATAEQTLSYGENPDVSILYHTDKAHAVFEKNLGLLGAVFYEADSFKCTSSSPVSEISADGSCCIMISKNADGLCVSLSDPTQQLKAVTVTLKADVSEVVSADDSIKAELDDGKVTLTVKCENLFGASSHIKLK